MQRQQIKQCELTWQKENLDKFTEFVNCTDTLLGTSWTGSGQVKIHKGYALISAIECWSNFTPYGGKETCKIKAKDYEKPESEKDWIQCPKEGSACITIVSYNPTDNIHIHIIKH